MRQSFIQVLFLHQILHKSCFDPLGSDCLNNGWSISNRVGECGGYKLIGRFGEGTQLTQTFQCPEESKLKLSFILAKIDSWDAEHDNFQISYDGITLDTVFFDFLDGTHMCYHSHFRELYANKSYQFTSLLGKTNVTIKLRDNFDEAIDNESWGIRNVQLEIIPPCVDFFSECNYQGNLWRICAGNQTSLTKEIPFPIKSIKIKSGITVKMKDPKYFGGNTQVYTTHQSCLTDFKFPKYQKQN